ncbi:MAG: hypothetical protein E7047_09765, partial [Lentisphaerae bacterium]|nr:hypothetical protein [Lentisphaerota bacterium]
MKKTLIFAIGTLISSMVLAATGGKPVVMKGATQTADGWSVKSGGYFSETMFEVDTSADYLLSGTFRGEPGAGNFNFGLQCFDSKKRTITGHSINPIEYTLTELVQAAVKGNDYIVVKDGSRWLESKGKIVMFNAQADLSDLPNYNQHYYLKSVEKHADGWKVTFDRPLKVNYPKACPVRLHGGGDWLCHIAYTTPTAEWKTFNVLITGEGVHQIRGNKFGYGTKFVKLALYTYPGKNVQFKDLALRKISPAEAQKLRNRANSMLMKNFHPTSLLTFQKNDGELIFQAYPWGGIGASKLNLQADKIKAVEIDAALTTAPCNLVLLFRSVDANGKVRNGRMDADIHMDGKYHTIQFPVSACAEWRGTIQNIEFRCDSSDVVDMQLRDLNFLTERNLIEGASNFAPGKARIVRNLWPRGKYTLRWSGEANPGATLKISDRHGNLLESVELPAGTVDGVTFTVPYNGVQNTLTVNGEGKGNVVLDLVSWKKFYTPEGKMNGSWIWCQDAPGPEKTYVWFKRDIQLDSPVEQALMALAVDDSFDLYINGKFVGHGYPFTSTFRYDIAPYLKPGKNEIKIRTFNGATWGGALFDGFIRAGKQYISLASDEKYLFAIGTQDAPQGEFKPAVVLGPANTTEPWSGRVEFRYIGEMGEMEILDNSTFGSFKAQVKHIPVIKRDRMQFKLISDSGKVIQLDLRIKFDPADYKVGDTVTVTYAKPPIMLEKYRIIAFDDYIKLSAKDGVVGIVPAHKGPVRPLAKVKLTNTDAIPTLLVDGKKMSPFFWQIQMGNPQANHSQIIGDAVNAGSNIINIQVSLDQSLHKDMSYDFRAFEQRVAVVLSENPDSYLMTNVYLHMPQWWLDANPDNITRSEKHAMPYPGYNTALGSMQWRMEACKFLKTFVAYVQKQPWGHRLLGVNFCNSSNGEWFWETSSAWGMQGYEKA